jgi:hypothetical protein
MITVEFEDDETCITVIDTTGEPEYLRALLYDDYCHIRQWNEKHQMFDVITLTPEMYVKLMKAWFLPEGTYILEKKRK